MAGTLQGVLAGIPGLGGYLAGQQNDQQNQMGQLQQVGALQGILSQVQKQQQLQQALQQQQALKGALSSLPADATPDQVMQAVRPFVGPDDLFKSIQSSQDRRFTAEQNSAGRRDALEARLYDIETRSQDRALDVASRERLAKVADATRRELAQMGFDLRRDLSGDKDKPQAVVGVDAQGNQTINWARPSQGTQTFQTRPPSLTTSGNQQALALRRDYNANPEVKLANSLEPKVGPTAEYIASVGRGMGNSVGDAELVKLWLMTTHPKGDQISNMDYRQIQAMPDLYGRIKNVAGNFVFGKTLDSDTRADMWKSVSQKFKATAAMREKYKADILGRGKNMGIDQSLIFGQQPE